MAIVGNYIESYQMKAVQLRQMSCMEKSLNFAFEEHQAAVFLLEISTMSTQSLFFLSWKMHWLCSNQISARSPFIKLTQIRKGAFVDW